MLDETLSGCFDEGITICFEPAFCFFLALYAMLAAEVALLLHGARLFYSFPFLQSVYPLRHVRIASIGFCPLAVVRQL